MKEPTRVTTHTARPSTHRCRVIAQQAGTVERIILTMIALQLSAIIIVN